MDGWNQWWTDGSMTEGGVDVPGGRDDREKEGTREGAHQQFLNSQLHTMTTRGKKCAAYYTIK